MQLDENAVIASIVAFIWIEYCWELFLSLRQIRVYKTNTKIPQEILSIQDAETFEKARVYQLEKSQFGVVKQFVSTVINTIVIVYGFLAGAWRLGEQSTVSLGLPVDNEIVVGCFFMMIINVVTTLLDIPFSIYHTFVVEERHGFNKQTVSFFIKDHIKSFILGQVVSLPIVSASVYIIKRGGNMFIVWLWLFTVVMILLLVMIYPSLIAPLFDKFSPLPDGPLRSSIEALASSLKFPLGQLYVVEGSKRSAHSNAYFYGLFGTKRIVLFDTLLENYTKEEDETKKSETEKVESEKKEVKKKKGCTDEEVLAVLAHELGHWKHGHIYINMIVMQINLLLTFAAFGYMFRYSPLYVALGFPPGVEPILVGLVAILQLVLAPYNAILSFGMTVLSRKFEFQADDFAFRLGHSKNLKQSLIKLNTDNLGFPIYDSLYSAWHHSHPTLLQRLQTLKQKEE